MAAPTPQQLVTRRRIESLIRLAQPALDLVLLAGDRVSRIAGRGDPDEDIARLPPREARITAGGRSRRS